jgi:hypothetical protein
MQVSLKLNTEEIKYNICLCLALGVQDIILVWRQISDGHSAGARRPPPLSIHTYIVWRQVINPWKVAKFKYLNKFVGMSNVRDTHVLTPLFSAVVIWTHASSRWPWRGPLETNRWCRLQVPVVWGARWILVGPLCGSFVSRMQCW